jgi:hypothetical protein
LWQLMSRMTASFRLEMQQPSLYRKQISSSPATGARLLAIQKQ